MDERLLYHAKIQAFIRKTKLWREFQKGTDLVYFLKQILDKDFIQVCQKDADLWYQKIQKKIPNLVCISLYDPCYPKLLKEIYDPPIVVACLGNLDLFSYHLTSIVGTRKASPISLKATESLVESLKHTERLGIVSGMALGIDRKAFLAALDRQIPVLGVLGTTIELQYPPGNRDLYKRVEKDPSSLLMTEFLMYTEPAKWTFPKRNRVIAGLSERVYIMESGKKSGTISTALSAINENREIYVFDHPSQFDNAGGKKLILDGAERLELKDLPTTQPIVESSVLLENSDLMTETEDTKGMPLDAEMISFDEWRRQFVESIL
ncbi:MAG: DNA-protecting protein DprA [Leptospira sp.]|nr:DNA-protecting protein DprA [Leptospira sp.]